MKHNKITKTINILVLIIFIVSFISYFPLAKKVKKEKQDCVYEFQGKFKPNNHLFYWKEDDVCCTYKLVDEKIREVCKDG